MVVDVEIDEDTFKHVPILLRCVLKLIQSFHKKKWRHLLQISCCSTTLEAYTFISYGAWLCIFGKKPKTPLLSNLGFWTAIFQKITLLILSMSIVFSENRGLVYNWNRPNKKNHTQTSVLLDFSNIDSNSNICGLHQTLFHTF